MDHKLLEIRKAFVKGIEGRIGSRSDHLQVSTGLLVCRRSFINENHRLAQALGVTNLKGQGVASRVRNLQVGENQVALPNNAQVPLGILNRIRETVLRRILVLEPRSSARDPRLPIRAEPP